MIDRLHDIWNWLRDLFVREKSCTWVRARMAPYIDWDVDPREYVCIEQHLTRCDACRQEHEELHRFLAETFGPVRPPGLVEVRRDRLLAAVDRLRDVSLSTPRPRKLHSAHKNSPSGNPRQGVLARRATTRQSYPPHARLSQFPDRGTRQLRKGAPDQFTSHNRATETVPETPKRHGIPAFVGQGGLPVAARKPGHR